MYQFTQDADSVPRTAVAIVNPQISAYLLVEGVVDPHAAIVKHEKRRHEIMKRSNYREDSI